jgi:hypothetical protein
VLLQDVEEGVQSSEVVHLGVSACHADLAVNVLAPIVICVGWQPAAILSLPIESAVIKQL